MSTGLLHFAQFALGPSARYFLHRLHYDDLGWGSQRLELDLPTQSIAAPWVQKVPSTTYFDTTAPDLLSSERLTCMTYDTTFPSQCSTTATAHHPNSAHDSPSFSSIQNTTTSSDYPPLHDVPPQNKVESPWRNPASSSVSANFPPTISGLTRTWSTVTDATPIPTVLTDAVLNIGASTLEKYDEVRLQYQTQEPYPIKELHAVNEQHLENSSTPGELNLGPLDQPQPQLFSLFSSQQLETYFIRAVDVKNALKLRRSAIEVDISAVLGRLSPKLNMYAMDAAVLTTVLEEIKLIEEECKKRDIDLNFYYLEHLRSLYPYHDLSVTEEFYSVFADIQDAVKNKESARKAAQQYYSDPIALKEHRLPLF